MVNSFMRPATDWPAWASDAVSDGRRTALLNSDVAAEPSVVATRRGPVLATPVGAAFSAL
jgi:hypothetical protein